MAQNWQVLVDDQDTNVEYLCTVTTQTLPDVYYNGTWTNVASPTCGYGGWFRYSFIGTGAQIGIPITSDTQRVSVQIDNRPQEALNGNGLYVSSYLNDGPHNITVFATGMDVTPGFDYLTYTAGPSTPLYQRTIIQNDDDAALAYGGHWSVLQPRAVTFDDTLLHQGTAHWSTTVGDTVSYRFTGTSITVMGVSTPSEMNASLTFTLDGKTSLQTVSQTKLTRATAVRLFHAVDLNPAQHMLDINVMNVSGAGPIGINFFAYNTSLSEISGVTPKEKSLSGGIIGGLIITVGLVICFFAWKWQQNRRIQHKFEMMAKDPS